MPRFRIKMNRNLEKIDFDKLTKIEQFLGSSTTIEVKEDKFYVTLDEKPDPRSVNNAFGNRGLTMQFVSIKEKD